MKKKIVVLATLVICAAIMASGTLAYYTAEDTAHNVITSGGVAIEVVEKMEQVDAEGKVTLVDFPENEIMGVLPSESVSKIVTVENTGASEAWIRVKVEMSITAEDGSAMPLTFGTDEIPVMEYEVLEGWVDGGDGYYYYEESVAPNAATGELFTEVNFAPGMGNEYQNCTANVIISAQAVQVANNGDDVLEAAGWPE